MHSRRDYQLGVFFVTAGAVTWSSAGFFTRLIDLDYPTMIAGRGIFGAIGMLAQFGFLFGSRREKGPLGWLGVLAAWAMWRGLRITWLSALSIAADIDRAGNSGNVIVSRATLPAASCVRLSYQQIPGLLEDDDHWLHEQVAAWYEHTHALDLARYCPLLAHHYAALLKQAKELAAGA